MARYGLAGPERPYGVDEVAARIRELGLRTVRLAVVDQHGVPRGKMMSPEAAIAAMSDGLDFSGAIYSLDTGNQVFVPAFARGGGFGIAEFTGFPDVVLVPDPGTFRVLPWADRTGWMLEPSPSACRDSIMVPAGQVNGVQAFAQYKPDPAGGHAPWSLQVHEVSGGRISRLTFFLDTTRIFPAFGLPPHLT